MEIDIKADGQNPGKFWLQVVGIIIALTGGSGATSYVAAQQATKETATITAKEVAAAETSMLRSETNTRLERLESKIEENGKAASEVGRDVEWIKSAIIRIEQRQYQERENP